MLEPQGFYEALTAYHLPLSIIDLDCSAQANVPYQIKTAHVMIFPFFPFLSLPRYIPFHLDCISFFIFMRLSSFSLSLSLLLDMTHYDLSSP